VISYDPPSKSTNIRLDEGEMLVMPANNAIKRMLVHAHEVAMVSPTRVRSMPIP
jgi:hypothetical protein